MPSGVIRGVMLAVDSESISLRSASGETYECGYDRRTLFTRNHWPIRGGDLQKGDAVEVVADRRGASPACYTRIVSLVVPPLEARRLQRPGARPGTRETPIFRGGVAMAGLVTQMNPLSLTLRTASGLRTFVLRKDTRYVGDGVRLEAPADLVNRHVFIRAGETVRGTIEAYQVFWGEILKP